MADQQLIIQLQAQIGDTLSQLQVVQAQVNGIAAAGAAAAAPVTGLGAAFAGALGGIALAALQQLSRKFIQFGKDAVDAFTKADSAARQFQNTLVQRGLTQESALVASNAIGSISVTAGFEPEAMQQAMSNMIVKMNSGKDATLGMQIAMDNARIKGITLATSIQSVSIAALGSLKSLRQFGITTNKDVNGNLKTANALLKEMADRTKGGLATYMASPLGMIDAMKVSMQELKEAIGAGLTNAFAPVAQAVKGFAGALAAGLSAEAGTIGALNGIAIGAATVAKWLFDATKNAELFWISIKPPTKGFDRQAFFNEVYNQKFAGDTAMDKFIEDLKKGPDASVKDYMKDLEALIADIQTGEDGATKSTEKWMAAFAPLKLLSGSIPNLAKYVGNLSSSFVLRSVLDINIHDNTTNPGGPVQKAVDRSLRQATRGVTQPTWTVNTNSSRGSDMFNKLFGSGAGGTRLTNGY
jgi:hypothetical protein